MNEQPAANLPCPKCKQIQTVVIDQQTLYQSGAGDDSERVPVFTTVAYRCQNPECRHVFTRTTKH